ncbi:unnamed protein product [Candida verbasci]|uniref:F-box domain-containing protein n=1 Tax=Candida verbasci TaxID=1227364 RepID=A0A9W4X7Z6_9ASCO|nr:unnamed protein product [Candida verbasci]
MSDSRLLCNSLFNDEDEDEDEEMLIDEFPNINKFVTNPNLSFNLDQIPVKQYPRLFEKYPKRTTSQPYNSIISKLPPYIISIILEYVSQFDLVNLCLTCSHFYRLSIERLYKRITIIINAELPVKYSNSQDYIIENGLKHMDSSLIFKFENLIKFITTLNLNFDLIQFIKYFIFDKCLFKDEEKLQILQNHFISFFGKYSTGLNFLHISFIDFNQGIVKLTNFLKNANVRNKMFKLLITSWSELFEPFVPSNMTNLFMMLQDQDVVRESINLNAEPYNMFNSLFTLTVSTTKQLGLSILDKIVLNSPRMKLKLKGLTIFHKHKVTPNDMEDLMLESHQLNTDPSDEEIKPMKLDFESINSKIDINYLSHLYLKVDCNEHRDSLCNCFEKFFNDFSEYSRLNNGLPNLKNFEIESYPNLNWLRPHQQMENILVPLGGFIKTLGNLSSLTIDFSTPGFKMFDNNLGLSNYLLNKLNEHLMEAFFLSFFTNDKLPLLTNLKVLQLPDFFTSFVYYKPDFMESLLHTCKCWGCQLVLEKLEDEFFDKDEDIDLQSSYYMLIGYILGKLQADREVCIPIKEKTFLYSSYPIFKGQAHTLHLAFHKDQEEEGEVINKCKCDIINDSYGLDPMNIDTLVTTYIVHQIKPIIKFLSIMFLSLENLMIHGIYYEKDLKTKEFHPIYDSKEYPDELLQLAAERIQNNVTPKGPFGNFRK